MILAEEIWKCTTCHWEGTYSDTLHVMYHGIDWEKCPSCGSVLIPMCGSTINATCSSPVEHLVEAQGCMEFNSPPWRQKNIEKRKNRIMESASTQRPKPDTQISTELDMLFSALDESTKRLERLRDVLNDITKPPEEAQGDPANVTKESHLVPLADKIRCARRQVNYMSEVILYLTNNCEL